MPTIEFESTKTTRVSTNQEKPCKIKYKWFVLHGYGQLANYFIRSFNDLDPKENFVIAPEAQSRYYLNGTDGRVGATWMTKEQRETDIKDYINYLNAVFESFSDVIAEKTIVLGFSQGAATACRWLNNSNLKFDVLVLWAGVYPPDLNLSGRLFKQQIKTYMLVGDRDEYIDEERLAKHKEQITELGLKPEIMRFVGPHKIENEALKQLVTMLK